MGRKVDNIYKSTMANCFQQLILRKLDIHKNDNPHLVRCVKCNSNSIILLNIKSKTMKYAEQNRKEIFLTSGKAKTSSICPNKA